MQSILIGSPFIVRDAAPPYVDVKDHVLELDHALSVLRCPLVNEPTETVQTYFVYAVNGHADSDDKTDELRRDVPRVCSAWIRNGRVRATCTTARDSH